MNNFSAKKKLNGILAVILCVAMLLAGLPVAVSATQNETKSGELLLATISDTHYYPKALAPHEEDAEYDAFIEKLLTSNVNYETLDYLIDSAFDSLEYASIEKGLKYVVLSGDLTLNGEKQGHEELAQKLQAFERATGLQVFVSNGNHDINNSRAASYNNTPVERTTPQDFLEIYYQFGFADAYHTFIDYKNVSNKQSIEAKAGMLSYSVQLDDGYRLIMLDAGHYSADVTEDGTNEQETSGGLTDELFEWLMAEIEDAKANGETPVMTTHWNISGINYLHEYVLSGFVIDEHYKLQEILADAGLHYVFSGHEHVSDVDITYSDAGEVMYSIITPTLTEFPAAYRLTSISYDKNTGSYTSHFGTYECNGTPTVELTADYSDPMPNSISVFRNQFCNADSTAYLMRMVRNFLVPYANDIKEIGGIIPFIEHLMEIDLESTLNDLLKGGIVFADFELFTAKNIMWFLEDLDAQIVKLLVADPEKTCDEVLEPAVEKLLSLQISEKPCTKFINTIGFGNPDRGGTLADMLMSVFYYMYEGNENISDDPFVQDVLANMQSGAIVKPIVEKIIDVVVHDIVMDTLLANIEVRPTELFVKSDINVIPEFDSFNSLYEFIMVLLTAGCFDWLVKDGDFSLLNTMKALMDAVLAAINCQPTDVTSYLTLAETVLKFANLKYGSSVDEVIDYLLDEYIYIDSMVDGIGDVLYRMISGCVIDDDLADHAPSDNNVTYVYNGPIEIAPTQEEMQLPSLISGTFGADASTTYNLNWYTKYYVDGTDLELYQTDKEPNFTGKNNLPKGVQAKKFTTQEVRSFNGVDVGVIGLMSVDREVYRHRIELTGLTPGTTYYYRIGDAARGYWSETGKLITPSGNDDSFTFLHMSDTQSITQEQYGVWGKLLQDAVEIYPETAFVAHTGDFVDHGDGFMQWKWGLDSASDHLINMAIMPTAGNHEAYGTNALDNYFHLSEDSIGIPQFTETGTYYSYDYNNVHFVVLNTNDLDENNELSAGQVNWMREDIEQSDADWIIVQMHKSIYSKGSHVGDDDVCALRNQLSELFTELDIDLVLSGHDHVYMRTQPVSYYGAGNHETVTVTHDGIEYEAYADTDGTMFVSSATSGVKKYNPAELSETAEYFPNHYYDFPIEEGGDLKNAMFSAITVDGTTLTFTAYTYDDNGALYICDKTALTKTKIEFMSGDADADGTFTPADARTALRLAVGLDWKTVSDLTLLAADFNGDGKIGVDDARRILRCSVGLSDLELVEIRKIFKGELDSRYE